MCDIARTEKDVFKALVDLSQPEQDRVWRAYNLKRDEEKDRAHEVELAKYRQIIADCKDEIEDWKKKWKELKAERDELRKEVRKLKRLQGIRGAYKQTGTNRIFRLVAKHGRDWDKIGRLLGMNPGTVESRFYREQRKPKGK